LSGGDGDVFALPLHGWRNFAKGLAEKGKAIETPAAAAAAVLAEEEFGREHADAGSSVAKEKKSAHRARCVMAAPTAAPAKRETRILAPSVGCRK